MASPKKRKSTRLAEMASPEKRKSTRLAEMASPEKRKAPKSPPVRFCKPKGPPVFRE